MKVLFPEPVIPIIAMTLALLISLLSCVPETDLTAPFSAIQRSIIKKYHTDWYSKVL